ncbi:MAG: FlgD immunoglobulin-like domain containing protein [Candidatus Tenebribacter mawsonii]|nr:FlgD immunoglobulin-like domain containing protein [Candidatus Tenebribacter mawsonii]
MKYLLVFVFLISITFSCANIIIEGPYAQELQWIDGEWHLELTNSYVFPPSLEMCYLQCVAGFSYFNAIGFPEVGITEVTKNDLNIPYELDLEFDEIELGWEGIYPNYPSCYVYYGGSNYSMAPHAGESLVRKSFLDPVLPLASHYYCRDNSPTMGQPNDNIGFTGTFSGNVINEQGNPLAGAVLEYYPPMGANQIFTNLDGEFSQEMYTVRYDILVKYNEITFIDTLIYVAPDSNTVRTFVLPVTHSSPSLKILLNTQMSVYPNPFNPSTTIRFSIPLDINDITIDIFNSKGQKVKTLKSTYEVPDELQEVTWDGLDSYGTPVASGVYYARLVGDGIVLKESKMLLLK